MQKPVYLPQYTGHSEKGSTPLLNVQAAWCPPQASCGEVQKMLIYGVWVVYNEFINKIKIP